MSSVLKTRNGVSARAFQGDAMTLLAFDLDPGLTPNCVGFTIECVPPVGRSFFLSNRLSFDMPITGDTSFANRAKASKSTQFSPIQKFRWLHVPASSDSTDVFGKYTYRITPRYWVNDALADINPKLTVELPIDLKPFEKGKLQLGFTRAFMISQAYSRRFGNDTSIRPKNKDLAFDTSEQSGTYPASVFKLGGKPFSYQDQYEWMGWQARQRIIDLLNEVLADKNLTIDVFAYDFDEPDIAKIFLQLAAEGRIRMILDNSTSHVGKDNDTTEEDAMEKAFKALAKGNAIIVRGKYRRFAHHKTIIVKKKGKPQKLLVGSTNFSINGLYINANHVVIMENAGLAKLYEDAFEDTLTLFDPKNKMKLNDLVALDPFSGTHDFTVSKIPVTITIAPHSKADATKILDDINDKIIKAKNSVLFAVMGLDSNTSGPLIKTLRDIHQKEDIFSYGITDKFDGVVVFRPDKKRGKLVDTTQLQKQLPPPFDSEIGTAAHRVHHKFIVLDFKGDNPVVYCGSSNLALLAEQENGDNLLEIRDQDIATAFAIEAIRLIDHYHFRAAAAQADDDKPLSLDKTSGWLKSYYTEGHLKHFERMYFIS